MKVDVEVEAPPNRWMTVSRPEWPSRMPRRYWKASGARDVGALTSICGECMNFHMRTTLVIDDGLFRELKRRAAEQNRTLSEVTQDALRRGLAVATPLRRRKPSRLLAFAMGPPRVDLADRNQLYDVLDRS